MHPKIRMFQYNASRVIQMNGKVRKPAETHQLSTRQHRQTSLHLSISYVQSENWELTKVSHKTDYDSTILNFKENSEKLCVSIFRKERETKATYTFAPRKQITSISFHGDALSNSNGQKLFPMSLLSLKQLSTQKPTGILKRKARKCLIKYMINMCISECCVRLRQ